eukprot:sb/3472016/
MQYLTVPNGASNGVPNGASNGVPNGASNGVSNGAFHRIKKCSKPKTVTFQTTNRPTRSPPRSPKTNITTNSNPNRQLTEGSNRTHQNGRGPYHRALPPSVTRDSVPSTSETNSGMSSQELKMVRIAPVTSDSETQTEKSVVVVPPPITPTPPAPPPPTDPPLDQYHSIFQLDK